MKSQRAQWRKNALKSPWRQYKFIKREEGIHDLTCFLSEKKIKLKDKR